MKLWIDILMEVYYNRRRGDILKYIDTVQHSSHCGGRIMEINDKEIGRWNMSNRSAHGLLMWMNDIEVCKTAYLLTFPLLILNLFLIRQPIFEIIVPQVDNVFITLHEIGWFSILEAGALLLGGMSILLLLIPIMKSFEWKYRWFFPAFLIAVAECISVVYLNIKKNELIQNSLLGYIYSTLSIEVKLTVSAWLLLTTDVIILLCVAKIMLDIRKNYIKYEMPLKQL